MNSLKNVCCDIKSQDDYDLVYDILVPQKSKMNIDDKMKIEEND